MIISFSIVADWSIRHREMGKVSLMLLRRVQFMNIQTHPRLFWIKIQITITGLDWGMDQLG